MACKICRYFEKRRKRLKGHRDDEDLNQESQIVEFHDLKGTVHVCNGCATQNQ